MFLPVCGWNFSVLPLIELKAIYIQNFHLINVDYELEISMRWWLVMPQVINYHLIEIESE